MSTDDVPGANPSNGDELKMGCWAEHDDGSLMFVYSTESNRVIYSLFDLQTPPPMEYRDAMAEATFKKAFSWRTGSTEKWTWHDKTPFPWDRIIKAGIRDGLRPASAADQLSAARRVADNLRIHGAAVTDDLSHMAETTVRRSSGIWDKLSRAVAELGR